MVTKAEILQHQLDTVHLLNQIATGVDEVAKRVDAEMEMVEQLPDNGPVEPPEPPVTEGLILAAENITAPVELPVGKMLGTKTIIGIMKVPAGDGVYRKLVGADSTKGMFGGLCVGQAASGEAEFWLDDGTATVQIRRPTRPDKRAPFSMMVTDLAFSASVDLSNRVIECKPMPLDGIAALGKGVWKHAFADPATGAELIKVEIWAKALSWEQIEAKYDEWVAAGLIDPIENGGNGGGSGGNGGGPVEGDLEPVKPGVHQVEIKVDSKPRQTWLGFGWGAGPANEAGQVHPLIMRHKTQLYDELDTKAVRLIDPNAGAFISAYKPLVDFARNQGVDVFIATGFYRRNNYSMTTLGEKVAAAVKAGIPITHVCGQNEPEGNPKNSVILANLPGDYKTLRTTLDNHGCKHVQIIANEYAHFGGPVRAEFNVLKAAGLIPNVVAYGAGHNYSDCCGLQDYEQSWGTMGIGLFSVETGYMGNPHAGARFIAGINHGVVVEIAHLAQSRSMADNDLSQKLLKADGTRLPWHAQYRLISQAIPPGTVMRLCTSTDKPADLPSDVAVQMQRINNPGRYPRINVACGQHKDGKWGIVAVNTTLGGGVPDYLGACYPAETLQLTVAGSIPDRMLTVKRCNSAGAISDGGKIPLKGGKCRFTLNPAETLTAVG